MTTPMLYIMVGMPSSGKSTWAKTVPHARVVDIDEIVTSVEGTYGNYDVRRKPYYKALETLRVAHALEGGRDVVLDRTCYKASTRKRFIDLAHSLGAEVTIVEVVTPLTPVELGVRRYLKDSRGLGVEHWIDVCESMADRYESPTSREGFDHIQFVQGAQTVKEDIA